MLNPVARYVPALDGLRGIAILLVLWHHGYQVFGGMEPEQDWLFWRMSEWGWLGVDLFFVVSGFLITSLLLAGRDHPDQLKIFWWRRILRIQPPALLYLCVLYLLVPSVEVLAPLRSLEGWWMYFFYLGNLHIAQHGWPAGPLALLWSLAIEEQFYLVWPLLVRALTPVRLAWLCGALILLTPVARALALSKLGYPAGVVFTLFRFDGLALGALTALLFAMPTARERLLLHARQLLPLALMVLAGIMLLPPDGSRIKASPWFGAVGYSSIALACAVLVVNAMNPGPRLQHVLENRALVSVGKVCYSLYLWHFLTAELMYAHLHAQLAPAGRGVEMLLWLALTGVWVVLSWVYFEQPLLRLKDLYRGRTIPLQPKAPPRVS